jgi:hypothetical protein
MRIITINPTLDMETLERVSNDGVYLYDGPIVDFLGGASSAENANAKSEQEFMQQLQAEQQTQFGNEQQAQSMVEKAWAPIVAGGAYQYGFSSAEDQQLQQNIENKGAEATTNTENAALLREQQESGGANAGPAGATEALNAQVAATGAQSTATALGQEKELGYETGRQNFENAVGGETSVAELSNPTAYAGQATGAAGVENQSQQIVDAANANSLTSKLLGGVIGAIPGTAASIGEGLQGGGGFQGVASSLEGQFA